MYNRKKLNGVKVFGGDSSVFVNDDLTMLRSKMFSYAKELDNIQHISTSNGRIHCNTSQQQHVILDTPEDLFKLSSLQPDEL